MKRIVSVLTAVLLFSAFVLPCSVFAAGNPTFAVSSVSADAGAKAEVKISIKNNPGIASAKLEVAFDSDLTLEKVTYGSTLGGTTQAPQSLKSPVTLSWYAGANYTKDGEYATLTFSVAKTARAGKHDITVSYNKDDVFNIDENNVEFIVENGAVTVAGSDADTSSQAKSEDKESNNASEESVSTTGEKKALSETAEVTSEGSGDYTGGEVVFDDEGNVIEVIGDDNVATVSKGTNKTLIIVLASVAAVVIIGGGAAFLIYKKKKTAKVDIEE